MPKGAQAEINARLRYMENLKIWVRPHSAKLKGSKHIHEIRIKWQKNQYRPLGFFGPNDNEFTLLIGAVEKDSKFEPKNAIEISEKRYKHIMEDGKYIDDYFKEL